MPETSNTTIMTDVLEIEASVRKLNRFFFVIIIPLLGVVLPNIAGIISNEKYTWWQLLISYAYFIFIAFLIWKGNMISFRRIRKKYEQQGVGYYKMLLTYFLRNIIYSGVITIIFLLSWQFLSKEDNPGWRPQFNTISIVMLHVILINAIYELALLRQEMEDTVIKFKRMEIAKMQAELEALKAQIDPHFIFNSLNTLSYLITTKPEAAKFYNQTLAKVYRYILLNKDKDLVLLKDELDFISNYFYLIKIRFEEAVNMIVEIPDSNAEDFLITPVSLQMLVENAIKHNYFSNRNPLIIRINIQSYFVAVRNRIKRKDLQAPSSGIGLKNLKERYQLIMKKNIIIHRDNEEFLVKVPILKA